MICRALECRSICCVYQYSSATHTFSADLAELLHAFAAKVWTLLVLTPQAPSADSLHLLQGMLLQHEGLNAVSLAWRWRQCETECASLVLLLRALAAQHVMEDTDHFYAMRFEYPR